MRSQVKLAAHEVKVVLNALLNYKGAITRKINYYQNQDLTLPENYLEFNDWQHEKIVVDTLLGSADLENNTCMW